MILRGLSISAVARATPELQVILQRALSTSAVELGGEKRTIQRPPREPRKQFGLRNAPPSTASRDPRRDVTAPTTRRRLPPISSLRSTDSFTAPAAPTLPSSPFSAFQLHPALLTTLHRLLSANSRTTPIQSLSIPHFLSSRFLHPPRAGGKALGTVLAAETGSGKTLAYLLPLLHHLKRTDRGVPGFDARDKGLQPRAVVISPTHELTRQSTGVAKAFSHDIKLSVVGASDTAGRMRRGGTVDVLFSTGGSLRKMLGLPRDGERAVPKDPYIIEAEEDDEVFRPKREVKAGLDLGAVEWVVIDEADVLFGPDFADETLSTLSLLPRANLILVSATLPPSLTSLLEGPLASYHWTRLLSPGLHRLPSTLSTTWITTSSGNLFADVTKQVRKSLADDDLRGDQKAKVLVFANSDRKVTGLVEALQAKGVAAMGWTGEGKDRTPGSQGALTGFLTPSSSLPPPPMDDAPRVLVTTSLLSRGLDFGNVSTVILLDPPRDTLDFVHRAGRAGRAGRKGRVVVFGMGEFKDLAGRGSVGRGIKEVVRKPSRAGTGEGTRRQQPIRAQREGGRMRS